MYIFSEFTDIPIMTMIGYNDQDGLYMDGDEQNYQVEKFADFQLSNGFVSFTIPSSNNGPPTFAIQTNHPDQSQIFCEHASYWLILDKIIVVFYKV